MRGVVAFQGAARWTRVAAVVTAAVGTLFWLVFAAGEVSGGDLTGLSHLAPVVAMALLVFLALRNPPVGALALLAVGVAWGVAVRLAAAFLLLAGPFLVTGLLMGAAWLVHRRKERT